MINEDEAYLMNRLSEGSVSAYSTTHFTQAQNKLLQKWVRQGKVLKAEMPIWSGNGNRYRYYLATIAVPVVVNKK